MTYNFNLIN